MAIQIKDTATLAKKFADRASGAVEDYKSGVRQPKRPWQASAAAAAPTWASGVQDAISRGAFAKGVNAATDAKWSTMSLGKGADHFPSGVRAAQGAWQAGAGPFLDALRALDLPVKGIRGAASNRDRVAKVDDALHTLKLGQR